MARSKKKISAEHRSPVFDVPCEGGGLRMILPVGKGNTYPGAAVQPHAERWPLGWREELRTVLSQVRLTGSVPDCLTLGGVACAGILYRAGTRGKDVPLPLYLALTETIAHSAREVRDEFLSRRAEAMRIAGEVQAAAEAIQALAMGEPESHATGMATVAASLARAAASMAKARKKVEKEEGYLFEALVAEGFADEAVDEFENVTRRPSSLKDPLKAAAGAALRVSKLMGSAPEPKAVVAAFESLCRRLNDAGKFAVDAVTAAGRRLIMLGEWLKDWATRVPTCGGGVSVGVIDDHTPKVRVEGIGTLRAQQGGHGVLVSHPLESSHAEGFAEKGYGKWVREEVAQTLKASGGYAGGGSETVLVTSVGVSPVERNLIEEAFTSDAPPVVAAQSGDVAEAEDLPVAEAGGRQVGDDVHPAVVSTLLASGAGLSRVAGVASEMGLVVVHRNDGGSLPAGDVPASLPDADDDAVEAAIRELEGLVEKVEALAAVTPKTQQVRRLSMIETGRLQGFHDGWTAVPARLGKNGKPLGRNKDMSDEEALQRQRMWADVGLHFSIEEIKAMISDRAAYRLHGNSMTVPVVRAIYLRLVKAMADWTPERFLRAA